MSSSSTQLQRKQSKNPLLFFLCVLLPTCDSFLKFFIHHFIFSRIPLLHLDSSVTASLSNCFHLLCSVQGAYFICFFSILIRFFFSFLGEIRTCEPPPPLPFFFHHQPYISDKIYYLIFTIIQTKG